MQWRATGGGRPGERGAEGIRNGGEEGQEAGFPRWREAGEREKNYATLRNISQSKKCKEAGANKYRAETGLKGTYPPPPTPYAGGNNTNSRELGYLISMEMVRLFFTTVACV